MYDQIKLSGFAPREFLKQTIAETKVGKELDARRSSSRKKSMIFDVSVTWTTLANER